MIGKYLRYFDDFTGRDKALHGVTRYSLYSVMFYRTDLVRHSRRVGTMVAALAPRLHEVLGADFDVERAIMLGLVHDDAEIVFGDVQAGNKSKMTAAQLQAVADAEEEAIKEIVTRFPESVGPYRYQDLLEEAVAAEGREAQVMKCLDKFDAFGEALHEIYAGNTLFTTNVINEYGTIPIPPDYYTTWYQSFYAEHPEARIYQDIGTPFAVPAPHAFREIPVGRGRHTRDSVMLPSGYAHYDWWKSTLLADTESDEGTFLITQQEFLA